MTRKLLDKFSSELKNHMISKYYLTYIRLRNIFQMMNSNSKKDKVSKDFLKSDSILLLVSKDYKTFL